MLRLLKLDQKLADDEKKIVSTVKEIEAVQKTASWLVKAEFQLGLRPTHRRTQAGGSNC